MKYIQKQFAAEPIKGKIVDTTNITDDVTNTYSARIIHELIQSINSEGFGDNTPIGSGMDYYGTVAPENYMFADGSAISRIEYSELFAVIGTTYGAGDGSTTFNLPDKRSRVSAMYNSSDSNFNALGKKGGSATHTLTEAQLPKLSGAIYMHSGETATNIADVEGKFSSGLTTQKYKPAGDPVAGASSVGTINWSIGSGNSHNNLQPYLVCNYIIKVKSASSVNTTSEILAALEGEY